MSINRIIINRLLFRFLPIIGLYIFIVYFSEINFDNVFEKFDLFNWILIGFFVYYCFDLIKLIKKSNNRNKLVRETRLKDVPTHLELPSKLNFLDKRISIKDRSIDITLKNRIILHLSKDKKQIEIKKAFGTKILDFDDMQFIFLEYNHYEKDTLIDMISGTGSYDKTIWNNIVIAKLKNGKHLKLFEGMLEETHNEQWEDYQVTGEYEEKSYLEHGKKIVRLFSHFTRAC